MVIQTNITGVHTMHENIKIRGSVSKTVEKLSSGFRINRAADDVAGLSVSESMRAQITELARAQRNVQEGIDVSNTADGALAEINSMLIRARELCIEGANGIYTQPELDAISDELNEIFDDIDRITAGTRHNDIQLFRYEGSTLGTRYDYNDFYNEVPPDKLVTWGAMDFVQSADFDAPSPSTPATVTFELDSSIDPNDVAATMDGKSIKIGNTTYNFDGGGGYVFPTGYTIDIKNAKTVQDALNALVTGTQYNTFYASGKGYCYLESATVNGDGTVTLTLPLRDKSETIQVDGLNTTSVAVQGDGSYGNGITITSTEGTPIMKIDSPKNDPVYGSTATKTFSLSSLPASLSADNIDDLQRNTLYIGNRTVDLKGLKEGMTPDQVGAYLVGKINSLSDFSAQYDSTTKGLTVTASNLSTNAPTNILIQEETVSTGSSTPDYTYSKTEIPSQSLGITCQVTQSPTLEAAETTEITLNNTNPPCSFTMGSYTYVYYDSSVTGSLPPSGFTHQEPSSTYTRLIDVKNLPGSIAEDLANRIKSRLSNNITTPKVEGNKITISCTSTNTALGINNLIQGTSTTIRFHDGNVIPGKPGSKPVLKFSSYMDQDVSVSFDFGNDPKNLIGAGFLFHTGNRLTKIEFTDGTSGVRTDYTDVDISGCTDMKDVIQKLQSTMGSNFSVTLNGTTATITGKRLTTYNSAEVIDGYHDTDGIFTSPGDKDLSKTFSGGADTGYSQTVIDFSSINDSNLETLLGKGFRIHCATCEGEYINIFFCWENNGEAPESFFDPVSGRTIHNIAVELSKVSDGAKIVDNIVSQVSPQLKHYTGVKVGDPPTQLIAYEKLLGEVKDGNDIKRGWVESGVYTNFEYSYEKVEIKDTPPAVGDGGLAVDFRKMLIYVGSEPDHQWIPIHLPWLDLPTLGLQPPEAVDLGGGDDPFAWLERVDAANGVIITSRTRIGADYNRLEHTYNTLTQARENMEDSESRIRDADMAKLMVQYMKDQIIGQAQQSMMLHSNERPQQILELLR